MQSQLVQDPLSRNGGFSSNLNPPSAPDSMTPRFTQCATPYYNVQPSTQRGSTSFTTGPGTGHRHDGLPIRHPCGRDLTAPGYYSMAGPWEAPVPQPSNYSGCTMPIVQYDNLGQVGPSYAQPGYDFSANRPQGQTSFSPLFSGAHAAPNNQVQGGCPVWCLYNSWINYATQDEILVTIAFKRIPSA